MTTDKSKQTVRSLSTGVRGKFVEDFLSRMDDDYFETFSPEEVANHLQLASRIDENNPVLVQFSAESAELREIVIVGYDYPSGFSILCGLLSAFGMDIRSGEIHSFSKRGGTAGRIVDVLKVAMKPGEVLDEVKQKEFEQELRNLTELLASGSAAEARARLNRFLIERIERMGELLSGLTSPVHLTFNNSVSEEWTVLETRSEDAFAFLFAISNALAMRGIYIHKVRIRSEAGEARDQFYIANRWNRKIEDARDQQRLHMAVSMIKEFTHFLPEAPDPAKALTHFDQFLDKLIAISEESYPDRAIAFLASSAGMSMLAHLLGSSDFLWDDFLQIHFADLLPVLEGISKSQLMPGPAHKDSLRRELRLLLDQNTSASLEEQKRKLNTFKDRRVFLIDATHIVYPDAPLTDFSYALTDLGEVFVEEASRICFDELRKRDGITSSASGSRRAFAVFGLGKFGGREMGYASDFELLFVYEDSEQAASAR